MRAQIGTLSNAAIMLSKFPSPLLPCLGPTFSGKDDLFAALGLQHQALCPSGKKASFSASTYQSQGKSLIGPAWECAHPLGQSLVLENGVL